MLKLETQEYKESFEMWCSKRMERISWTDHVRNEEVLHRGKSKICPITGHEGPEGEYRYSSTLSLTSALDGVGG
jgi:hypothetical protein